MSMNPADDLLNQTLRLIAGRRNLPLSTYRIQFHAGFTFRDAAAIVPYLRDLGISHLYASPYLKATPGSTHGYDIVDHHHLNPELGSTDDYNALVQTLHDAGLSHILDTVPNHVGVATDENPWWNDVLEHGPASHYADHFDIAWRASPRPELHDKVLLPILGQPYAQVLENAQLQLSFDSGTFFLHYYARRFPIDPSIYGKILSHRINRLAADAFALAEYHSILSAIAHLPTRSETTTEKIAERHRESQVIKRRLADLASQNPAVRQFIEQNVAIFNGSPNHPHSFDLLDDLLSDQCYRLAYWLVAPDEINYRRFFDVNDLAALNMSHEHVFQETHELILRLLAENKLAGLRIDHPDGLYDPQQYFRRLQRTYVLAVARTIDPSASVPNLDQRLPPDPPPLYVVAEKILACDEPLPQDWSIYGTSGYDFLNIINALFVDSQNESRFTQIYSQYIHDDTPFAEIAYRKKLLILDISLASELHMLTYALDRLAQRDRHSRDYTFNGLRSALRQVIACFPVYRSYITDQGPTPADRCCIDSAVAAAVARNPQTPPGVFHFIRNMLLLKSPDSFGPEDRAAQRRFAGKFQQLTAPTTAKGIEDTAFYVYNRLVCLNEVGGEPGRFGLAPSELHSYLQHRQTTWPYSLSPLSTHDTKRSEDVRARLNVLSELPDEFAEHLACWTQLNHHHKPLVLGKPAPAPNDEYLLYQTLLGAWPLNTSDLPAFLPRIQAYMQKALRESKTRTSWTAPNEPYESAVQSFAAAILDDKTGASFLADFLPFQARISRFGLFNSLAQTLLRLTAPGVPDTYQGTELFDFSLVDPDNRRPVDYAARRQMLESLAAQSNLPRLTRELTQHIEDSRFKLFLMWKTLQLRRSHPALFSTGQYTPVEITGPRREHVFAFTRSHEGKTALVAVPRLLTRLPANPWEDAQLLLPQTTPPLRNVFTDQVLQQPPLAAADLFSQCPVALLISEP